MAEKKVITIKLTESEAKHVRTAMGMVHAVTTAALSQGELSEESRTEFTKKADMAWALRKEIDAALDRLAKPDCH